MKERLVIFLDADGVLNSDNYFRTRKPGLDINLDDYPRNHLDMEAVGCFEMMVRY